MKAPKEQKQLQQQQKKNKKTTTTTGTWKITYSPFLNYTPHWWIGALTKYEISFIVNLDNLFILSRAF